MKSKYIALEIEKKWQKKWQDKGVYSYDDNSLKKNFVIDTPPPTVSGSLHIGHVFSYTQTDILARFQRMNGKNIFYPMGWDDNGLPSEKRVQDLYHVACDPSLPYKSSFKRDALSSSQKKSVKRELISRKNFKELCQKQVLEDEKKYKSLWNHLGLSVDWKQTYETISSQVQKISQFSFLDLYKNNFLKTRISPLLWDTQFQTAVAQADVEDRERKGHYHDIKFKIEKDLVTISTTRPELLISCVALAAHPDDKRYKKFFSKTATTPLFFSEVPVFPSSHVDPEKGTGLLMVCTFGDMEDVRFWEKHKLPLKQIIDKAGRLKTNISFTEGIFKSLNPKQAEQHYKSLQGLKVELARKTMASLLKDTKNLVGEPRETLQSVKYYEKGNLPLELISERQWFITILDYKKDLLNQGKKVNWHPQSLFKRYEQWVEGLNQDWCISRQRFFGIPFPVWYPLDTNKKPNYNKPLLPESSHLPIDPMEQVPKGYKEEQRNQAGGFTADKNVMDTWATSSLTPFINSGWVFNKEKHKKLFPADLRPQAHEIIRTWAFYTIAKSYFHEKQIPWKHIAISGWVMDPQRSKMSKSKGNILTPEKLIETYSADALRYWSGKAQLGQDTIYDENILKVGKKLVTKIFNASKFVLLQLENSSFSPSLDQVLEKVDQAWILHLLHTHKEATQELENFNYSTALHKIEKIFWNFCDNYLELVKARTYQDKNQKEGQSSLKTVDYSLFLFLKLFSPYLPYITEEIWSLRYGTSSIHKSDWKIEAHLNLKEEMKNHYSYLLKFSFFLLEQIRKEKSSKQKSLATPVKKLTLKMNEENKKLFSYCEKDISRASHTKLEDIKIIVDSSKKSLEDISIQLEL